MAFVTKMASVFRSYFYIFLLFVSIIVTIDSLQEAEDGSVCFNNCNGHGKCIDYSCLCFVGYHGDDCRTTFARDENNIIPILSAGHFNVTKKTFKSHLMKNKILIVGFSSPNCHKCIIAENDYSLFAQSMKV